MTAAALWRAGSPWKGCWGPSRNRWSEHLRALARIRKQSGGANDEVSRARMETATQEIEAVLKLMTESVAGGEAGFGCRP